MQNAENQWNIIQSRGLVFMWKLSPPISPPVRCGILLQFAVWIKRKTADNDWLSAVFIVLLLIFGIPSISIAILLICILSALADEIGHELVSKKTSNRFVNLFFEYRFTMKVVILLLAIFGAFSFWIFICFLLFEIAYGFAGFCYEKIYWDFLINSFNASLGLSDS